MRGTDKAGTFRIFTGVLEARKFVKKYFQTFRSHTYSGTAEADGRGHNAYCTITKNVAWFQHLREDSSRMRLAQQLARARALRRPSS